MAAGHLDQADGLLQRLQEIQDRMLEEGRLARPRPPAPAALYWPWLGLRYRAAATLFADAARRAASVHETKELDSLHREAMAWQAQGNEFGDNPALETAIDRWRALLLRRPRQQVPLVWAMTQNNLGSALRILGERESRPELLEEAVAAYREALQEWTRERVPLKWAATQYSLGLALLSLGEREGGPERLEEAVAAWQQALEVFEAEGLDHYSGMDVSSLRKRIQNTRALIDQRRAAPGAGQGVSSAEG
ncbi:MAG: tetratricopeptide repeat protein [Magnetococcales bacterium]|nr:tetratricopeptide repeat protein [Magnetococcales bacterium]